MSSRSTLLFVSHSANFYGAERSLLDLLIGLRDFGCRVLVLVPGPGPLLGKLEDAQIEYLQIPYRNWAGSDYGLLAPFRIMVNVVAYARLARLLAREPVSLVYSNTAVVPIGALLARRFGVPHIWHLREFVEKDIGARFYLGGGLARKLIARLSERVICNSEAVRSDYEQLQSEKFATVYNGILSYSEFKPGTKKSGISEKNEIVLCIVGALAIHKGQEEALRALALLRKDGVNAKLRIVGKGSVRYVRCLRRFAKKLGVQQAVVWEGYCSDVSKIYQESDITLICSRAEAFGRTAVESMAAGTPVIGSNSGGLPEILEDVGPELLYTPEDHAMLASQIKNLVTDDLLYQTLSARGYRSAYARFTKDRYVSELKHIISRELVRGEASVL